MIEILRIDEHRVFHLGESRRHKSPAKKKSTRLRKLADRLEFTMTPNIEIPKLPFDQWKHQLLDDCVRLDLLAPFDALDDGTLRALWLYGINPSLTALVENEQLRRSLRMAGW